MSSEGVGAIVIAYNITLLNTAVAMLLAMGAMSVLSRAIGEKDQKTINKLCGNVLIGVSIVLILPKFVGETGAWLAMPMGDLLTLIMSVFLVKREF